MKTSLNYQLQKFFSVNLTVILLLFSFHAFGESSLEPLSGTSSTENNWNEEMIVTLGGADPSGGEGQDSDVNDLKKEVQSSFSRLPFLFHRIKFFFNSNNKADMKIIRKIKFIESCYKNDSKACKNSIINTIVLVDQKFQKNPFYTDGDCPSKNSKHKSVDMSIDDDLNLCISNQLTRYPPQELKRQVFSLLSHEIMHALGFGETKASSMQFWMLEYPGISFPSSQIKPLIIKNIDDISLQMRLLARFLIQSRDLQKDRSVAFTACNYSVELHRRIKYFIEFFNNNTLNTLVLLPFNPLGEILKSIFEKSELITFQHCIENQNNSSVDLTKMLPSLVEMTDLFEKFHSVLYNLSLTENFTDFIPNIPNSKSLLTILLAHHIKLNPAERINTIQCNFKGEEEKVTNIVIDPNKQLDQEFTINLKEIIPSLTKNDPSNSRETASKKDYQLKLHTTKFGNQKGIGILLQLIQPTPLKPFLQKFTHQPKVLSTNAVKVRKSFEEQMSTLDLLQILNDQTPLKAKIILNEMSTSGAKNYELEVHCSNLDQ